MRLLGAAVIAGALAAGGCGRRIFYGWADEFYLRRAYAAGWDAARARMRSRFADDRDIGCRALSMIGREARRAGDDPAAREAARILMVHWEWEPDATVRSTILGTCLRNVGDGDEAVHAFLKERVAFGGESASAAYTLAALRAPGAFEAIASRYRGNHDHGLRYELLGALWLLGDARAVPVLEEALAEMERRLSPWPRRIHHMRREDCARTLRSRLETLKAAARADGAPRACTEERG